MKNRNGFSLVELLAVVAIMAILFGIGVTAYTRYMQKARNDAYNAMVLYEELAKTLLSIDEYVSTDGLLLKNKVYEDAMNLSFINLY